MKTRTRITALILTLLPVVTYAQLSGTKQLIQSIGDVINTLITLVAGLALLAFFWGLVKYIFAQGNEGSKTEAKRIMGWGLAALFVMVSVWGIIGFIQHDLGLPVTVPGGFNPQQQQQKVVPHLPPLQNV